MGDRNYDRICTVCGKKYKYCAHCGEYNPREPWRYNFCSEDCRSIYRICNEFTHDIIGASDAKKKLADLFIPTEDALHPYLNETIRRIQHEG